MVDEEAAAGLRERSVDLHVPGEEGRERAVDRRRPGADPARTLSEHREVAARPLDADAGGALALDAVALGGHAARARRVRSGRRTGIPYPAGDRRLIEGTAQLRVDVLRRH